MTEKKNGLDYIGASFKRKNMDDSSRDGKSSRIKEDRKILVGS